MLNVIFWLIASIGFWAFFDLMLNAPKSNDIRIILEDIFKQANLLIKNIFKLLIVLIFELCLFAKVSKSLKIQDRLSEINKKKTKQSNINESDYALEIIDICNNFKEPKI